MKKPNFTANFQPKHLIEAYEHVYTVLELAKKIQKPGSAKSTLINHLMVFCLDQAKELESEIEHKQSALKRLNLITDIIETVENRCMVVDGPVTKTLDEMTNEEMRRIYRIARGEENG